MSYSLHKDQIIQDADDGSSDDVPELASEGSDYSGSDDERPSRARNGGGAAARASAAGGRAAPQAAAAPAAGGGDAMPALGAVDDAVLLLLCCVHAHGVMPCGGLASLQRHLLRMWLFHAVCPGGRHPAC